MSMMLPQGAPPPGLAALIAAHGGGDADDSGPPSNDGGLKCLQDMITDFPRLLHELTDPGDVQMATRALHMLTQIQQSLMGRQGGNGSSPSGQ